MILVQGIVEEKHADGRVTRRRAHLPGGRTPAAPDGVLIVERRIYLIPLDGRQGGGGLDRQNRSSANLPPISTLSGIETATPKLIPEIYNTRDWGTAAWQGDPSAARDQILAWVDRVAVARNWPTVWRVAANRIVEDAYNEVNIVGPIRSIPGASLFYQQLNQTPQEARIRRTALFFDRVTAAWSYQEHAAAVPTGWSKLGRAFAAGREAARNNLEGTQAANIGVQVYETIQKTKEDVTNYGLPVVLVLGALAAGAYVALK